MVLMASVATLHLIIFTINYQKGGLDVPLIIYDISKELVNSTGVQYLFLFKVSGEAKLLALVKVSDYTRLEWTLAKVWRLGNVDIETQSLVPYEIFARTSLNVSAELTKPVSGNLQRDSLYWLDSDTEYYGKSLEEYLAIWKQEAELGMQARIQGQLHAEFFKVLGARKLHVFINIAEPDSYDSILFQTPMYIGNGNNVHSKFRLVYFLEDYLLGCRKN